MAEPTYPLSDLQALVRAGAYAITYTAAVNARVLGFDEDDVVACVLALVASDCKKTMESETKPGSFQDVYNCRYSGVWIYLKLRKSVNGDAVVIQFKRR